MMKISVNGATAPTNTPPASHAHQLVSHQTTLLQRKQIAANDACIGAARL
jgi:hypothetical protein